MSGEARWVQRNGLSDLSAAVDEIYRLRAMCAEAVEVVDYMLEDKRLAGFRQSMLAELRPTLIEGARGDLESTVADQKRVLRRLGIDDCLSNQQWAKQRGLQPTPPTAQPRTPAGSTEEATS